MPRVPSDKTITHRIELGIPERQKLDELLTAYKENNRIDGVTATLQAAGSALAGGGMIWAAAALAAYLAPGLIKSAYNKTKDFVDETSSKILSPIVDPIVADFQQELEKPIKNARNKITEATERRDRFCSPGINFDNQQCTIAQNDLDAAYEEYKQAQENLRSNAANLYDEKTKGLSKLWDLAIPISPFYNPYDQ